MPCFCAVPDRVMLAPEHSDRLLTVDPCFSCQLAEPYTAVALWSPLASWVMSACCLLALRAKHCPQSRSVSQKCTSGVCGYPCRSCSS